MKPHPVTVARSLVRPIALLAVLVLAGCDSSAWPAEVSWPLEATISPHPASSAAGPQAPVYSTPHITNGSAVRDELRAAYPDELRQVGIRRSVELLIYIDEHGNPETISVLTGSGVTAVDEAALQVAHTAIFAPATDHGSAIGSWWTWRIVWPLLVIDGVPRPDIVAPQDIPGFDMRDVASLEILDHADNASRLYGDWAGDAVIVITTVDGKYGSR